MNTLPSASSVGRAIRCAGCGHDNPADRKFCGQCGGRLWKPCLECQSINAVDERFCGECGVNLEQAAQKQEGALRAKLEMAIKLEREGRFYDAQAVLREIAVGGDERLAGLQDNAQELLRQLEKRKQQRTVDAQKLEAQARLLFKQQQYVQAFEILKSIPVGLRHHELIQFMVKVEGIYKEIKGLTSEVKQALKEKSLTGLIPKVERLAELQPDNQEVAKLAERLQAQRSNDRSREALRLAALAQKKVAAHLYREAAVAVNRIAPEFIKGKVEQVYRHAKELACCVDHAQGSTVATKAVGSALARWQQLAPTDPRPQELAKQLEERQQAAPKDQRYLVPSWAPLPTDTAIGYPVRLWSGFGATPADDAAVHDAIGRHPGQFLVAYGLALQGIGQGHINTDLNPKRNAWGKLLSRKKTDRIWGLDIGSTSVKALEMVDAEGEPRVTACLHFAHSKPLYATKRAEEAAEIIETTVAEFVEETGAKKPRVALGFSGRLGLARFFDLPPIKSKKTKLEDAVGFEMRAQTPIPMEDALFDYHAWNPVGDGFVQLRPVAAIAARKDDLQQWVAPITAAGCDVALLQCDGFALANALHREFLSKSDRQGALAVLDFGGDVTNVVIAESNYVWLRSIVHGVKRWDEALVRDLSITQDQSARLRHDPSLARHMHRVLEALEGDFSELREDVQRTVNGYPRRGETEIDLMLFTGGGASQFGLLQNFLHGDAVESVSSS